MIDSSITAFAMAAETCTAPEGTSTQETAPCTLVVTFPRGEAQALAEVFPLLENFLTRDLVRKAG